MDELRSFVTGLRFEAFIMTVIVINVAIIAVQEPGEDLPPTIIVADSVCLFIYLIEMMLKMAGFGFSGYFESKWNWLDFGIVIEGLIAFVVGRLL